MSKHTKEPRLFATFTRPNGEPIKTVDDVIETTSASAGHSDKAELWGVAVPDDSPDGNLVICYTGNGPTSEENARRIADCVNGCMGIANPSEVPKLLAALMLVKCERCRGKGKVYKSCSLCGDSTFDHECDDGERSCPECSGTGRPDFVIAAIAEAEGRVSS